MPEPLLNIENLKVSFVIKNKKTVAVEDVNFSLDAGKIIGIVGESGCGKSVTATSILRLMPAGTCEIDPESRIVFQGKDLSKASNAEMRDVRGNKISMIFQEPMTSLNPVYTIGYQMVEMLQTHQKISTAHQGISAPAVRRYAPESYDCNGAVVQSTAADCRRTDHRAGCNHSGTDFASDEGTDPQLQYLGYFDYPRHGRCGRDGGQRHGHVRRKGRGVWHIGADF